MERNLIFAGLLTISGCGSPEDGERIELMDAIEASAELPGGSEPLDRYARAYKYSSPNRVSAVYFIPSGSFFESTCQAAKSTGHTNGQIAMLCPPPDGMKAGERRWLDNDVRLPVQDDGGCGFIAIEYSIALKTVILARCNGHA